MKRFGALCACIGLSVFLSGCTLGDAIEKYVNNETTTVTENTEIKPRVYMDEISGKLIDFNGSQLTLQSDEAAYTFDISQATLECEDGMISGDEISVIYEGQLADTDTSTVKALKVADEFHKHNQLEDQLTSGTVQSLTPNTLTLKTPDGKTATFPITGVSQYYQNGLPTGAQVYLHYKGTFMTDGTSDTVLNASHLKVTSISDTEPVSIPDPTPTPKQDDRPEQDKEKQLRAVIQNITVNQLTVIPAGSDISIHIDLSQIPVYFPGGAAPGSSVNIIYTGDITDFSENSLKGASVIAVTGDNPETMPVRNMAFTVSGIITGTTQNTVTIQSPDGAFITCFTENIQNASANGLVVGNSIRITFNPVLSRDSNIYTALKIEDA